MKTAISIPDKIFRDAERLSRRLKKSRSQVYTEAVTEYIARHDPEAVTEAMNRVCEAMDSRPDPAISAAASISYPRRRAKPQSHQDRGLRSFNE
jgi:antitoxin MazE6